MLARWAFGVSAGSAQLDKAFDVAVHVGTLAGAATYLRDDIAGLLRQARVSVRERQLGSDRLWLLVGVSAIPAAVVGAVAEPAITERMGAPAAVAAMLLAGGVVLAIADRLSGDRGLQSMMMRDAVLVGVAQAVALAPGVSRSGMTIAAARGLRLTRDAAARFSFLASLPLIAGAAMFEAARLMVSRELEVSFVGPVVVGVVASALSGWAAVGVVLAIVRRRSFAPFVAYRVVVGLVVLALVAAGWR